MITFAVLMYFEWTTDAIYMEANGKHGPYFFLIMGLLVVMEYVIFKEWLKSTLNEEDRKR